MTEDSRLLTGGIPAGAEELMRKQMKIGRRLYYPCRCEERRDGAVSLQKVYVPCRVVEIYPHLVSVESKAWRWTKTRTISYAEMLTDPRITKWEEKR